MPPFGPFDVRLHVNARTDADGQHPRGRFWTSLDSTLVGLGRGPRQRAAMDVVLRKGIFFEVKEIKPDFMRVVAGSAFFSQPYKYRNPLVRDLYHAYNEGRPANHPFCFLKALRLLAGALSG